MATVTSTRLAGHTMPHEGWPLEPYDGGWTVQPVVDDDWDGRTRCSCGEWSPDLPSNNARKRWHREHKQQVAQST